MKRSFLTSLVLHASFALMLFRGCGGIGNGNGTGPQKQTGDFIPKATEPVQVSMVDIKDLGDVKKQKKVPKAKCEESYDGIGIMNSFINPPPSSHANFSYFVSDVAPGYAADRAGVVSGDVVSSAEDLLGEPGSTVEVFVLHADGSNFRATLTREKICTKFAKEKEKP